MPTYKKIAVASKAKQKINAVAEACRELGFGDVEITGYTAASGINEQPLGDRETTQGAKNRLDAVGHAAPDADLWVAIENGIRPDEHHRWFDYAVVIVRNRDGQEASAHSAGIIFPKNIIQETIKRDFKTTTIGKVFTETYGGDPQDPHALLTHGAFPRERILAQAVVIALAQLPRE